MIRAMYEDATTMVRLNGRDSNAFSVKVGVHQGSVLSPILFDTIDTIHHRVIGGFV